MPWLKLTSKALYLMEGSQFLNKVDLDPRDKPHERSLQLPISWFKSPDPPTGIVVALSCPDEPTAALPPSPPPAPPHTSSPKVNFALVPDPWKPASKPHLTVLVQAFHDQGIVDGRVLAYAAATISRESSWNPRAVNTTDRAAKTGFPGAGLAQITWKDNYRAVGKLTGIDFVGQPKLMFDPYKGLRAKAAFFQMNRMIPLIEKGEYESAAGIYNAGNPKFRSSYTRNVAVDTKKWLPVFTM
ncbi:transglycosylase SLT domain-containing protein [Leptolyngbya sp. AN02str]|uniref:transglycosylase SLT domain-containing protein n=1 Tax=Leptolyngbya sp. AN02str TaxID=3423363 RepID=UPI003D3234F7